MLIKYRLLSANQEALMKKIQESNLDDEIDRGVALLLEEVQNLVTKAIIDKNIVMSEVS